MIQEKDFLYRVPVKTAPITTPGGQIRNPEILVDVEGGEFMHGNILDANSTNKLINQSVKEAVDNKLIESGYVTKDLLDAETTRATEQENNLKTLIGAETSARTKGDEDLSSKIKAEQTRAEGKEKEISDKLAIVNGDSNTEGSFRKAIADVVAAAPEDLDTLKEIADKLAGNDDLHTALNQAITEKADASALANEVSRATGAESGLQAAIATKADAAALSNYVLTTALNKQVDTLNTAISAKQDAGNYIPYTTTDNETIGDSYVIDGKRGITNIQYSRAISFDGGCLFAYDFDENNNPIGHIAIDPHNGGEYSNAIEVTFDGQGGYTPFAVNWNDGLTVNDIDGSSIFYTGRGIDSPQHHDCLATSDGSFKPISDFVLKTELPTVPTKVSQLTNDSNFITADDVDFTPYATIEALTAVEQKVTANTTAIANINKSNGIPYDTNITNYYETNKPFYIKCDNDHTAYINPYSGIKVASSDTSYVDITPSSMRFSNGDASCELNQYLGMQYLLGTSDDSDGFKLSPYGLRIGKKSDINANNNDMISISIPLADTTSSFKVNPHTGITLQTGDSTIALSSNGVTLPISDPNRVLTSFGTTIDITQYVLKSVYDEKIAALEARIAALEAKHPEATK